ncbi:Hint domain-containing protein [Ruegeria sp.]|uniref:Hint domain-containing protein n=1 Tax=Ruegeria sp. TaxID=1879320 RepID=UPI0023266E18|nr:Hint domain-containing protein [Ruegeria sp.]MDA7965918.1 Hint domain-containing protein [Ruegeria sp.]
MALVSVAGLSGTAAGINYTVTTDEAGDTPFQINNTTLGDSWLVGQGNIDEIVTVTFDEEVKAGAVVTVDLYDIGEDAGIILDGVFVDLNTAIASGDVTVTLPGDGSSIGADGRIDQNTLFAHDGITITINVPFTTIGFEKTNDPGTSGNGIGFALDIPCFCAGTRIMTETGERRIEDLKTGDLVLCHDGQSRPIRWIGGRRLGSAELKANPKLYPVRIVAGALGHNLPKRDLLVSRQHRMYIASKVLERMYGLPQALVAAHRLTELPGVYLDDNVDEVEYFHLLLDEHVTIYAEGAQSETLYGGPFALQALSPEAREEIFAIFPDLRQGLVRPIPAFPILEDKKLNQLVRRHRKNNKPLVPAAHPELAQTAH